MDGLFCRQSEPVGFQTGSGQDIGFLRIFDGLNHLFIDLILFGHRRRSRPSGPFIKASSAFEERMTGSWNPCIGLTGIPLNLSGPGQIQPGIGKNHACCVRSDQGRISALSLLSRWYVIRPGSDHSSRSVSAFSGVPGLKSPAVVKPWLGLSDGWCGEESGQRKGECRHSHKAGESLTSKTPDHEGG
jgi:hypothetical protein